VYTRDAILSGAVPRETISERITRGYHRDRSGDLHVLLEPHWIAGGANATHGTPYGYDAHIPLILMGPGIVPGRYRDHVALQDLAQTLAAVVEVEPPSGAQGRVLSEALRTEVGTVGSSADPTFSGRTPPAHRRNAP
jgi:arylsulfatase A-like enzyme